MKIFPDINFNKLKLGLGKTRENIVNKISEVLTQKAKIDEVTIEELQDVLISSDLGIELVEKIIEKVRKVLLKEQDRSIDRIKNIIKDELIKILGNQVLDNNFLLQNDNKPYVILIVGTNGSGKTTTIGKLAHRFKSAGQKVIIASGDTFRAAANNQLKTWARMANVDLIESDNEDTSAIVFDTIKKAVKDNYDIILIDTAGRLHNNKNLMLELNKVKNVIKSLLPSAPIETLLVIDGGFGQNALVQTDEFGKYSQITGLVLTKLDGTAKGGTVFQICAKNEIPIRYIGIGEGIDDLQLFNSQAFVDAIFS